MIIQRVSVRTEVEEVDLSPHDITVLNHKYQNIFGKHIQRLHLPSEIDLAVAQDALADPDYYLAGWLESIGEDDWGNSLCLRKWLNDQFEELIGAPNGNYRVMYDTYDLVEGKDILI